MWLPVSLKKKNGPFINTDCKPNPKNPKAPVCTNYTKKEGWQTVETHDYKPPHGAAAINFAKVITGIRYAWGAEPCCPTIDRGNLYAESYAESCDNLRHHLWTRFSRIAIRSLPVY